MDPSAKLAQCSDAAHLLSGINIQGSKQRVNYGPAHLSYLKISFGIGELMCPLLFHLRFAMLAVNTIIIK